MEGVKFLRPARGINLPSYPEGPNPDVNRNEFISRVVHLIGQCKALLNTDLSTITEINRQQLADDDTAWPQGPVLLRDRGAVLEIELVGDYYRATDDDLKPAEPVVMPVQATSLFFCARHDRSNMWICTGVITCEQDQLMTDNTEKPMVVWIDHRRHH